MEMTPSDGMSAGVGVQEAAPEETGLPGTPASPQRVWIDKNLAALGFFTPSSQRIKRERSKVVRLSQVIDGHRADVSATIVPSALHGLPVTADQDKFLALLGLLRATCRPGIVIENPVSFSSSDLLHLLGMSDSGKNHSDVSEWLDLMASTTIISEGAVYLARSRRWARDRFRVFDRAVSRGEQLEDGSVAERNLVWLSDWQLQNVNNRHLLPIDLNLYRRLQTHIGRALVLHLQIWLYASHRVQRFEKRYADLCQLLGVRPYAHHSKIVEKLGPALEELAVHGYLGGWAIERTSDESEFKVVFWHGPLFLSVGPTPSTSGRRSMSPVPPLERCESPSPDPAEPNVNEPAANPSVLAELTKRGVSQVRARQLFAALGSEDEVLRQIEWGDTLISRASRGSIRNPAGFLIALLRDNVQPPATFLSSRQQAASVKAKMQAARQLAETARHKDAYERYREEHATRHLEAMGDAAREAAMTREIEEVRARFRSVPWTPDSLRSVAKANLCSELSFTLPLMDFAAFVAQTKGGQEIDTLTEEGA